MALGQVIAELRRDWRRQLAEMKAEAPKVLPWVDRVHREGALVTHDGALWQAQQDTAKAPGHPDWLCVVAAGQAGRAGADGRSMAIRGTWSAETVYRHLDVAVVNGSSFVARHDAPGPCPGPGWQLVAGQGKRARGGGGGVKSASVDDEGLLTLRNTDGTIATVDLYPLLSRIAHGRVSG
jgi:hypothetical protein